MEVTMVSLKTSFLLPMLLCVSAMIGCGSRFRIAEPIPSDRQPVPEPKSRKINIAADGFDKQVTEQIEQLLDLSRQLRNLSGKRKGAINVDSFGEVVNSSWFTNRNGVKRMSIEEIKKGPDSGGGPDTSGPWTAIRAKAEGRTPGFTIRDSRGDRYIIKFDPKGYSELITGAEVVSTKLFYAAGYYVPENYIAYFHPSILKLGEKVPFTDEKGRNRFMKQEDLDEILERVERLDDGRFRVVASKFIDGIPKGPFKYKGTRKDDRNDIIPHQHRRELRGLRVIAAWLNHYDTKANNSFTSYTPVEQSDIPNIGEGYIKHYLLDFGSTLGGKASGPKPPEIGHENAVDPNQILLNIVTLGFYVRPWEKVEPIRYPSIGYFRSDLFHPQKYNFITPNPAFERMTNLDGYWGTKIVMSFTDEQLKTAVEEGQYSNPEAADYLLKIITERRDLIGRYWFSRMNPLDRFALGETPDGRDALCFIDLAIETGLESAAESQYRYDLRCNGALVLKAKAVEGTYIPLPVAPDEASRLQRNLNPDPFGVLESASGEVLWEFKIQTQRSSSGKWSKWVKVYLRSDHIPGKLTLLGVQRQE